MLDIKTFKSALEQLEEERKIPKEKILDAIEQAMAAAYKKDYGKKGQIIRAKFDLETGQTDFFQVKIVVDESIVKMETPIEEGGAPTNTGEYSFKQDGDERVHFNPEHHIMIEDAKKIKKGWTNGNLLFYWLTMKTMSGLLLENILKITIKSVKLPMGLKVWKWLSGMVPILLSQTSLCL